MSVNSGTGRGENWFYEAVPDTEIVKTSSEQAVAE